MSIHQEPNTKPSEATDKHSSVIVSVTVALILSLVVAAVAAWTSHSIKSYRYEEHQFRMTLVALNEDLDLMPVAQTKFGVGEGEVTPDVLFSRNGDLAFCTITAGKGVGDVRAQCVQGTNIFTNYDE